MSHVRSAGPAVVVASMAVWPTVAIVVAVVATRGLPERGATVAVWAMLALAATPVLLWTTRRALGPRAGAAAAIALGLGLLPTAMCAAAISWGLPIARVEWTCGMPAASLLFMGPLVAGGFCGGATVLGLMLSERGIVVGRAMPWFAVAAVVISGGVLADAAPRLARPSVDEWLASLPVVARLAPLRPESTVHRVAPDLGMARTCERDPFQDEVRCRVRLRGLSEPGPIGAVVRLPPCPYRGGSCGRPHEFDVPLDVALVVRHDSTLGVWLVEEDDSRSGVRRAFGRELDPLELDPSDLAGSVSPPRTWWALAVFGLLCALGALGWRLRLGARVRDLARAREGRVDGDHVAFDDGDLPLRGVLAHAASPGPALAWADAASVAPGYRDDGARGTWRVVSGSRAEVLLRLRWEILGCDALALAIVLVTAVPLLVAS